MRKAGLTEWAWSNLKEAGWGQKRAGGEEAEVAISQGGVAQAEGGTEKWGSLDWRARSEERRGTVGRGLREGGAQKNWCVGGGAGAWPGEVRGIGREEWRGTK